MDNLHHPGAGAVRPVGVARLLGDELLDVAAVALVVLVTVVVEEGVDELSVVGSRDGRSAVVAFDGAS